MGLTKQNNTLNFHFPLIVSYSLKIPGFWFKNVPGIAHESCPPEDLLALDRRCREEALYLVRAFRTQILRQCRRGRQRHPRRVQAARRGIRPLRDTREPDRRPPVLQGEGPDRGQQQRGRRRLRPRLAVAPEADSADDLILRGRESGVRAAIPQWGA